MTKNTKSKRAHHDMLRKIQGNTCPVCLGELPEGYRRTVHAHVDGNNRNHSNANFILACVPCAKKKGRNSFLDWMEAEGIDTTMFIWLQFRLLDYYGPHWGAKPGFTIAAATDAWDEWVSHNREHYREIQRNSAQAHRDRKRELSYA